MILNYNIIFRETIMKNANFVLKSIYKLILEDIMDLINLMLKRRSIRKYKEESISADKIDTILQAGLLSASSRGRKPWEFIVVKNKETLQKMAHCRVGSAKMLEGADCAIVVIADGNKTDVWVEDCSIAMSNMHLTATALDIGSCWIQGRLREAENGQPTEEYLREILNYPSNYKLEAILSLGIAESEVKPHNIDDISKDKIHYEKY